LVIYPSIASVRASIPVAALLVVVRTAIIVTLLFFVGATPSNNLISENLRFAVIIPIPFAVSIEEPPPIAWMKSAPEAAKLFKHILFETVSFLLIQFRLFVNVTILIILSV
jgi:hypothetical protein